MRPYFVHYPRGISFNVVQQYHFVDVDDYAFEPRDVQIRNGQWVDDEFEILDFLGR